MHPVRHFLCIHLPQWSITRYCRRHPEYRGSPIAIIQTVNQRRVMIDASDRARSSGVRDGTTAAEARAFCRGLICIEQNRTADRRMLDAFGRWLMRFTPIVANGWDSLSKDAPDDLPAALFLDLTGCERLFGGIEPIVRQIRQALTQFKIFGKIAVAPTPGASWALASNQRSQDAIIDAYSLQQAILPLPVAALRLDEKVVFDLHRLGLDRIGDLLAMPREQLPARFGKSLLLRLDQLLGHRVEPLTKLVSDPPITARASFEAPIEALENIWLVFEKLLGLVLADLTRRNHGVRQLRMSYTPDRGWDRPIVTRTIQLSRPHRDQATLLNLIRCEADRVDNDHGFVRFQLDVPLHEAISEAQSQLFEQQAEQEQMELERLFQRLRARLGEDAVIHPKLIESYIPERAWRPMKDDEQASVITEPFPPRPLTLLPMPEEIRVICEPSDDRTGQPRQFSWQGNVHRLTQVVGPERIAGEWWRGHNRTRDYYDVEDDLGRKFWMFRVLHVRRNESIIARWFLHGLFE